ncbi:MAG TPA: prolipoprotein diacylglyceryl transferase [Polyangiaceae bacterium]
MTSLPKFEWKVDPIFLQVPRDLVIGIAGLIAAYSLVQGMRKKGSDHYTTAALFGVLGFIAWKYMGEGLELRYYSLLFVGVFLGGYALLKWQIVRGGGSDQDAGDFIVYGVLGVLVGARLGHVLFYDLEKALNDPAWVFKIWTGGLASHGAVLGLITAMWVFTKRRGIPFLEGSDRFAFSAALGATLVRIGNLMNSEIVGRKVPDQSWGIAFPRFDREPPVPYRYPTQIYEIALGFAVLGLLFVIDKRLGKEKRPLGAMISSFFALYFSGRFFIEFYKEFEGPISPGSALTMGQILSLPGVALGLYGLYWSFKRRLPVGWPGANLDEDEDEDEERVAHRRKRASDEDEDEDEDEAPAAKVGAGKKKAKTAAAGAAAGAGAGEDDEDDDASSEREGDDEDEDDDERPSADRHDDEDDDADDEDEDEDEDEDDDDDDDDADDEDEKRPPRTEKPASVDPDVADEFDDKGSLKRRR